MNPLFVEKKLRKEGIRILTPLDFQRIFGVSRHATSWLLKNYSKKGVFEKIKNGLYILADDPPNPFLIANRLYEPSYISFDTALSYYGIVPETIYSVTSATIKATRQFEARGILFTYQKIKKEAYMGYRPMKYEGETVLIAEPEKALADYLYFVDLKKRELSYERMNLSGVKKGKLYAYIKLFKRPGMIEIVESLYDLSGRSKRIG